jgi:hypothetical protein
MPTARSSAVHADSRILARMAQALPGALRWLAEIEPLRQILAGTRAILYFEARADAGLTRAVRAAALG